MTIKTDQLEYVDAIIDLMSRIDERSPRKIALDLWKYTTPQTRLLYAALAQTMHTKPRAKLLEAPDANLMWC